MPRLNALTLACVAMIPTSAFADFNGWYGGLSFGQYANGTFESELIPGADDDIADSEVIGGFIGALNQSGNMVYGYEFAFSTIEDADVAAVPGAEVESPLYDIKYRIGYAAGNLLPYGVIGLSGTNIQGGGADLPATGFSFGAGLDVAIGDNLMVGAEYLYRNSSVEATDGFFEGDADTTAELLTVRVSFLF